MPTRIDSLRVPKDKDRRRKLSDDQKEMIKELNANGHTKHALAKTFGVSRRTIQFICNPQALKDNLERRKERGGSVQYYDKDKHRESMRRHREYKRSLHESF